MPFPHNFTLPNLENLELMFLELTNFNMSWLNCPKLKRLKLQHIFDAKYNSNNDFYLDFSSLHNLESLEISSNNINTLNDIRSLNLNENSIKKIAIIENNFKLQKSVDNEISYEFNNDNFSLPNLSKLARKLGENFICE